MSIAGLNDVPGYSSYYTLCEGKTTLCLDTTRSQIQHKSNSNLLKFDSFLLDFLHYLHVMGALVECPHHILLCLYLTYLHIFMLFFLEHIPVLLPGEVTDRPLRSCSPPPNIKAGFYSPPNVNYEDGANVTFSCDNYYNLTGNATITCRRGLWHPHVPVCRPQHSCE